MHKLKIALLTLLTLLFTACSPVPALAYPLQGTVTYVYDGDTILLQEADTFHRIRLASIDAPEKDQPYGSEATQFLRTLIQNKTVLASVQDTDKYGRLIAHIYIDDREISNAMLANGYAWHLAYFDRNDPRFALHQALELQARKAKLGLWQDDNPIAPWLWRTKNKNCLPMKSFT